MKLQASCHLSEGKSAPAAKMVLQHITEQTQRQPEAKAEESLGDAEKGNKDPSVNGCQADNPPPAQHLHHGQAARAPEPPEAAGPLPVPQPRALSSSLPKPVHVLRSDVQTLTSERHARNGACYTLSCIFPLPKPGKDKQTDPTQNYQSQELSA